ncbi:MAG: (E)-4-hydroxy-3-methylbut-2-enyl-diphosphate synthase [Verrucomicrobiae bacterium]
MEPAYRPFAGRRPTREVRIGAGGVGGGNPIRIQSMLTSDTMDTSACVKETLGLVEVGCEIVRITAPAVRDAKNLGNIRAELRRAGCSVPLVADIHFKPEAALEAALWVEKVRINPGNFADSKKFSVREYSDAEYEAEIGRIRDRFAPLVRLCKDRGVAIRIGTNHGSLSDRIMNRYGDTPLGMVESAIEFARLARELDFHELVFSMKSSNPKVMIQAYRLLVARLQECDVRDADCGAAEPRDVRDSSLLPFSSWSYPIHLGVTEAGDGEDGRIKSAIGIGSLLADGIGDTIRVSLTEDSIHEIPVAKELVALAESRWCRRDACVMQTPQGGTPAALPFDPFSYARRASHQILSAGIPTGGGEPVRVAARRADSDKLSGPGDFSPEILCEDAGVLEIDPRDDAAVAAANALPDPRLVTVADSCGLNVIPAFRMLAARLDPRHPILLVDQLGNAECEMRSEGRPEGSREGTHPACRTSGILPDAQGPCADASLSGTGLINLLASATNIGALLCDGIGDAVLVQGGEAQPLRLAYNILQAAGVRSFKTDYVACPSCGRTLFNLQETTARIKAETSHLKGVKIAIMGCIVNGPGEMADADFGYVGGGPGMVNLYVGKTAVQFNIPEAEAVSRLVGLIRERGRWFEPASDASRITPCEPVHAGTQEEKPSGFVWA